MKKIIICLILLLGFANYSTAEDEWKLSKSTHVIVYYKKGFRDLAEKINYKAEKLYDQIADYLGFRRYNFWLWDNRAKIYIYKDANHFHRETGQPIWSGGAAYPEEKIIKTYPMAKGFLETVLPHEMGHIIFREFVGFQNPNVPLWLDEGVASYQEAGRRFAANRVIRKAMKRNIFMNLEKLQKFDLRYATNPYLIELFYAEAMSLVDFLIKKYGRERFVEFCRDLRDGKELERAFRATYNFDTLDELDKAWQRHLNR